MDDPTLALLVGCAIGMAIMAVLSILLVRRTRRQQADELADLSSSVIDLRDELSADKETNRQLRYQLARATGMSTEGLEPEPDQEMARELEAARNERNDALARLQGAEQELNQTTVRLADRESKLVEYRDALKEIRLSLEATDGRRMGTITGEVPAPPPS